LGKTMGNQMVDMQLKNNKLIDRGVHILIDYLKLDYQSAKTYLLEHGSVRKVIEYFKHKT